MNYQVWMSNRIVEISAIIVEINRLSYDLIKIRIKLFYRNTESWDSRIVLNCTKLLNTSVENH